MYDGLATAPPLSQICLECHHPYSTFSERSRFCCGDCRNSHWKRERKIEALIKLLGERFNLADTGLQLLAQAIRKAFARFCRFAEALGYKYHTKKYLWRKA